MITQEHQSIIDLAIQACGSAEAAFEFALLNGLSVTGDLETGHALSVPDVMDVDVLNYYSQKGICPATAVGDILTSLDLSIQAVDSFISYESILQSDEVIVLEGQSFIDLAMIYCGFADLAADFALLNGLSVTETLEPGLKLKKPAVSNKKVQAYYEQKALQPATDIDMNSNTGGAVELAGIGYWILETNFIVS